MKTHLTILGITLGFLFLNLKTFSQIHPPGIEWQKGSVPSIDPFSGFNLEENQAAEDWWYDHKNSYIGGNQDGYICTGYANIVNEEVTQPNGCIISKNSTNPTLCSETDPLTCIYNTNTSNSNANGKIAYGSVNIIK